MRALVAATALALGAAGAPTAAYPSAPPVAAPAPGLAAATGVGSRTAVLGLEEHPLEQAARVAHQIPFSGLVEVGWRDGRQMRHHQVEVRGGGGAVLVDGAAGSVLQVPDRRLARGSGDEWALLWAPGLGQSSVAPGVDAKYQTTRTDDPAEVAGRPTTVFEVRDGDELRSRLYVDQGTGLLLERDHYDEAGQIERTVRFETLSLDPSTPPPRLPSGTSEALAQQAPAVEQAVSSPAPKVLGDGYVRLGAYKRGSVVHLHYSDGLYELSLFEQSGRLDSDGLPGPGNRVRLTAGDGRMYVWPGGRLLVWQAGPLVRTIVSDAPGGHLVEAARSVKAPPESGSLLARVRRACGALVDPIR